MQKLDGFENKIRGLLLVDVLHIPRSRDQLDQLSVEIISKRFTQYDHLDAQTKPVNTQNVQYK